MYRIVTIIFKLICFVIVLFVSWALLETGINILFLLPMLFGVLVVLFIKYVIAIKKAAHK